LPLQSLTSLFHLLTPVSVTALTLFPLPPLHDLELPVATMIHSPHTLAPSDDHGQFNPPGEVRRWLWWRRSPRVMTWITRGRMWGRRGRLSITFRPPTRGSRRAGGGAP